MEKKDLNSKDRKPKALTLSRETFKQLTPSDLVNVAGGNSRCYCDATAACCQYH